MNFFLWLIFCNLVKSLKNLSKSSWQVFYISKFDNWLSNLENLGRFFPWQKDLYRSKSYFSGQNLMKSRLKKILFITPPTYQPLTYIQRHWAENQHSLRNNNCVEKLLDSGWDWLLCSHALEFFWPRSFCNMLLVLHQHCGANRVLGSYLTVDEIDYFVPMP